MRILAKSTGRADVRDACSTLTLVAQCEEDTFMLTRLYRFFTDLESDTRTERAIATLRRKTRRFTRPNARFVMVGRRGERR